VLVTFSEFAAIKGCSKGAVTHACKSRIAAAVVEQDGKKWLDRDHALELWRKNTLKNNNAKVDDADPVDLPATPTELRRRIDALPDDAIPELNESRARREHYQAELAKLQVAQQRRELVPADEVKKQAFQIGRSVREALANLADRLSHQLAGETDPAVIHQLLSEEHRVALLAMAEVES
jgi:acetylglutamate synthase